MMINDQATAIAEMIAECNRCRESCARRLEMLETGAWKTRVNGVDTSVKEAQECREQTERLDAFLADAVKHQGNVFAGQLDQVL